MSRFEYPSFSSEANLKDRRTTATKQPTKRNMGLSVVVCIQLAASAEQKRLLYIATSGIALLERRFYAQQLAVTAIPDQLTRLGNRSRDADLARPLAPPDVPSSAGCRQRRTLTTSDRSAKRRTPTRLVLYDRSSQVVRCEGLERPAPTVCSARCTATLDPGSDKLN
jgi:hypothetical protein